METKRVEYDNGIVKEVRHFTELTKIEYHKILKQRVDQFVVWNKRIINPIDKYDIDSWFLMFWEDDILLSCIRIQAICPQIWDDGLMQYNYPVWDKATIVDWRIGMFPVEGSKSPCFLWEPEWGTELIGTANSMMEMYLDGHKIVSKFCETQKDIRFIGKVVDEWGYDGYRYVYEPEDSKTAYMALDHFIVEYESKTIPIT